MGYLNDAIHAFEEVKKYTYKIKINPAKSIALLFRDEHFYHLFGLHKIKLRIPKEFKSKSRIYEYLKLNHEVFENDIISQTSKQESLGNRVKHFHKMTQLLSSSNTRIVDVSIANRGSMLEAKYVLYDDVERIHLLLALVDENQYYIPSSWMVDIGREPHIIKGKVRLPIYIEKI